MIDSRYIPSWQKGIRLKTSCLPVNNKHAEVARIVSSATLQVQRGGNVGSPTMSSVSSKKDDMLSMVFGLDCAVDHDRPSTGDKSHGEE
jgi:hypothetical protein